MRQMQQRADEELVSLSGVTLEKAQQATESLQRDKVRYQKKRDLNFQKNSLQALLQQDEQTLRLHEEQARKRQRSLFLSDHLREVRNVFHRDCLPRKVAEYYLDIMLEDLNDVLIGPGIPFHVHSVQNLNFQVNKKGRIYPANRLSGGEKVIFALAFRMVVNYLFARELGLLCLDEPTVGLDKDNLACLEVFLNRLRTFSRDSGLQVLIVSHEPDLGHLFDHVISLV